MEVMPAQKKSARKHQGAPLFFKKNGESSFFRASSQRGISEDTPFDLLPSREEETSGNEKDLQQSGEQNTLSPVSTSPTGAYSSATQGVGGSTGNEDEISPEIDEEKKTEQEIEPEGSSALIQGASGDPDDQDQRERRESGNSVNFSENPQLSQSGLPSGRKTSPVSNAVKRGNSDSGDTLRSMEESFGRDFSDVRLHTDPEAVALNRRLGSQAFTYGKDIYFNEGKLNPATTEGKHLLAHELTHTIQQG